MLAAAPVRFFPKLTLDCAGKKVAVEFKDGQRLFDAVEGTEAEIIRGGCDGNVACGGCSVVLPQGVYKAAADEEAEVLEGIEDLPKNARLACVLHLDSSFDGIELKMGPR